MRVLMTADAVGGVWQYAVDLARTLNRRGVDVALAVLGPSPDAGQRAEAGDLHLIQTDLPLDWLSDGAEPVRAAGEAVAALAREMGADIVHLNMPTLATARFDVPVVAVAHGCVATWWQAAKPDEVLAPDYRWHRQMMAEGLRAADRLVAPTESYARIVMREYGLTHSPVAVHNGRAPGMPPAPDRPDARALIVGRLWDPVKGAELLDRVAARLSIPFDAAGKSVGPHGESAHLAHLHLLGQIDAAALNRHLSRRPIFVSAASFEPFGLAVLEAAAAGCPLILSDIDSFRELWGGAALFVPGDSETAYLDAIEFLIANPAERLRLGEAARERASRYTPDATADAMLAIYSDLLATNGRVAA